MEKESNHCIPSILLAMIGSKVYVGIATVHGSKARSFILSVEWLLCSISESTSLFTFRVEVDFTFAGVLWLFGWCQCVRTCLMFLKKRKYAR